MSLIVRLATPQQADELVCVPAIPSVRYLVYLS